MFDDLATERVIAVAPFTVRRVTRWSDCDPAGVVYTGTFPEFLISAVQLFRRHLFGPDWRNEKEVLGIGTPAKAISLVFTSSLWPDDAFDMAVHVGDIRNRTVDFLVRAIRADDGRPVFDGRLTSICVRADDRRVAVPIPGPLREAYARYRTENPPPADDGE